MNAGSSSSPYFTLTLPNEFLTYNIRIAAVNTQGETRSGDLSIQISILLVHSGKEEGVYMIMAQFHVFTCSHMPIGIHETGYAMLVIVVINTLELVFISIFWQVLTL